MRWRKQISGRLCPLSLALRMIAWCLFFTELNNRLLMNVCIPCSVIHSRVGQRLNGERMIRPAGEWKSVKKKFESA